MIVGMSINLQADCVNLLIKCYKEARRAIYLSNEEDEPHNQSDNKSRQSQLVEKSPSIRATQVKSKSKCGTRCCMCFDPFSIQDVSIYVFFCCHAYHETCLMDSIVSISSQKKKPAAPPPQGDLSYYSYDNGDDNDGDDDGDDDTRIRCILCTTAAG